MRRGFALQCFSLFKKTFQLEKYLLHQIPDKHRIALTKLRVSCHKFAIEMGRYHQPVALPVNQRLCSICNITEDEIHLVSDCVHYANLRSKLFNSTTGLYPYFGSLNSAEKLVAIEREAPNQQGSLFYIQIISVTIRHIATLALSCL